MSDNTGIIATIVTVLFLAVVAVAMQSCTDADRTISTLEANGFTDIEPGDYAYFGCGQGDMFHTEFTATSANGKPVSGLVCCGWFKSCTVRF